MFWYLGEIISKGIGGSQEEILEKKQVVEKVIDRLINTDNILIPISKPGFYKDFNFSVANKSIFFMIGTLEDDGSLQGLPDPVLIVHPNYVEDD